MQVQNPAKKTFPLKNLPGDIEKIIRDEQLRLELDQGLVLKREEVYYRVIREWKKQKDHAAT